MFIAGGICKPRIFGSTLVRPDMPRSHGSCREDLQEAEYVLEGHIYSRNGASRLDAKSD